jgi:hypothetical protein
VRPFYESTGSFVCEVEGAERDRLHELVKLVWWNSAVRRAAWTGEIELVWLPRWRNALKLTRATW